MPRSPTLTCVPRWQKDSIQCQTIYYCFDGAEHRFEDTICNGSFDERHAALREVSKGPGPNKNDDEIAPEY